MNKNEKMTPWLLNDKVLMPVLPSLETVTLLFCAAASVPLLQEPTQSNQLLDRKTLFKLRILVY